MNDAMQNSSPVIDVAYIARLAKIDLTEKEQSRLTRDLEQILDYVQQLKKWDTRQVEPMYHPVPTCDALRSDIPGEGLPLAAALCNAPQQEDDQFRVPKVVESAH